VPEDQWWTSQNANAMTENSGLTSETWKGKEAIKRATSQGP
jgi:hypothetical protein